MLRFILKTRRRDQHNGAEVEQLWTMDAHNKDLEAALKHGGFSEAGYEYTDLVGVEVRDEPNDPSSATAEPKGDNGKQ